MKPEELMIGDWVMYNPNVFIEDEYESPQNCYPSQIKSGEDIDIACESCYEPIPLTADILKKNGWNSPIYDGDSYYHIDVFPIYYRNDCYKIRYIDRVKINYVHELQHALRLCGLNDLANNFKI